MDEAGGVRYCLHAVDHGIVRCDTGFLDPLGRRAREHGQRAGDGASTSAANDVNSTRWQMHARIPPLYGATVPVSHVALVYGGNCGGG